MSYRLYCTILCLLACLLRPLRADPPHPVLEAINRLQAVENYSWSRTFETPGAPFTITPANGWQAEGGFVMHETRIATATLRAVTRKNRAVASSGTEWTSLPELVASKGAHLAAVIELASYRSPGEKLKRLWPATAGPTAESDGAYVAEIDPAEAQAILTQLLKNRGPGRAGKSTPAVTKPSGTLRIWLKDGLPLKYILTVNGSVSLPFGNRQITMISTVSLTLGGATNVVPAEAKAKLQSLSQP